MKTFLMYVILVLAFYVFSNVMTNAFLKNSYVDIDKYEVKNDMFFVDITEAKASQRNGYINGVIKNTTESSIENKYLKFSMLSKSNKVLGEKYIKIDKIRPQQLRKFEVKFDYDNVYTFKMEVTDTKPEEVDFFELVKTNAKDLLNK